MKPVQESISHLRFKRGHKMSSIRFARIFGNDAVLQRNKEIHIWGFGTAHSTVTVEFASSSCECVCDGSGRFDARFPAMDKGGPYTAIAIGAAGERVSSDGIMIGDVVIISGQSNMEYQMEKVRESYPDEWDAPFDDMIRTFKVMENGEFNMPPADVLTGEWRRLSPASIDAYSAVGYFTAKHLRQKEDVCIGLVDLTLGGASIEAFMSEEMLAGTEAVDVAQRFKDDGYRRKIALSNERNAAKWREAVDAADAGLSGHYEDGKEILSSGRLIALPQYFSDTELNGFTGSLWIAREFSIPEKYAGCEATLWFGTITDFDYCYVNGTFIGSTDFCYPPRRYHIPQGLLKEGKNTVVFRICVEKGFGRVTPGKLYGVVFGRGVRTTDGYTEGVMGADHTEPLGGVWHYLIGASYQKSEDTVFINWKPTALYNGMMAPLSDLAIKAFVFYQGESNCVAYRDYADLTKRFVTGIRAMWGDIPYICVQLPEFDSRIEEVTYDHGAAWRGMQAAQEECEKLPGCHPVRTYGYGELNDLHPQRKEPVGRKIADIIFCT